MVTRMILQPLGMGTGDGMTGARLSGGGIVVENGFVQASRLWIGAAIGAVGGIASSLIGGIAASNAAREAEKRQREAEAKEEAWYNRRYYEDYLDTAAGQNLVRRAKEYARDNAKRAAGAQAVAGGTDAATQMAKDAGNKLMGDTIANIAASDQQRKAQVDNMHRQAQQNFSQMDMNRELQRAQNISNASAAASNAMISVGSAVEQPSKQATDLTGGSNKGVAVAPQPASTPAMGDVIGIDGAGNRIYRSGGRT